MPGASLSPWFAQQFIDNNGLPLAGGKIYTYQAGTATPLAAYVDSSGLIAQTNPIILDGSGRAPIWLLNVSYKFIVNDSSNVTLYTVDNVNPLAIGTGSITTAMLADGSVTTIKLANLAVTTAKIADGAITAAKLAAGVGFLPDLAVGPSQTYTTIQSAINAATAGQSIYIQTGNYVENISITKKIMLLGSGPGVTISGDFVLGAGSDYSIMQTFKVMGTYTINAGVIGTQSLFIGRPNGAVTSDLGTRSFTQFYQE